MTTKELKTQLQQIIDEMEDEELLEAVYKILSRQKIVGYDVQDGTPITQKKLVERVKEAEKEVEKGNYITHEELKEKMKEW